MRTFRYDKLVRDKIMPEMIEEGSKVVWRKLSEAEFKTEIAKKLEEELGELEDGVGKDRTRDIKELADIAEIYETGWDILDHDEYFDILEAAMTELEKGIEMWGVNPDELLAAKATKIARMGAFKERTYIETVTINENNPWMQRYLADPDKYPEVK